MIQHLFSPPCTPAEGGLGFFAANRLQREVSRGLPLTGLEKISKHCSYSQANAAQSPAFLASALLMLLE